MQVSRDRVIAKVANLLTVGFFLSLDNFRTAVLLGPLRLRWGRFVQVALVFGLWDAVAPLVGLLAGHYIGAAIGAVADFLGPVTLGAFGLYLLVQAWRAPAPEQGEDYELEHSWTLFGLPLPLSVDNVVGGVSLGLLGFSPWLSAAVFGAITSVMTFIGLLLGRGAFHLLRVHIRYEIVTGVALIIEAIALVLLPD